MKKTFIRIFISFLILLFTLSNSVFSQTDVQPKYPDYSILFVGIDKWENFNRKIFVFNIKANKYIIRPLTIVWASVMPQYGMDRIKSVYANLNYPVRAVGSLLQNDSTTAKTESKRFLINTTMGILGLYDPAAVKFNIPARNENIEQALAYHNINKGNYLVLPIIAQGNTRDIVGQILDMPLNPVNYMFFAGPISLVSGGVSTVNDASYIQPILSLADNYADPYFISKQMLGIERYIQNKNIDRINYLENKNTDINEINISDVNSDKEVKIKTDVSLNDFSPQNKETDSMRSIIFDGQKVDKSFWAPLSLWNKSFNKKIKTDSVRIVKDKPELKFRYILQKEKISPLAILYPSIGEGINSEQSVIFAKILYDEGYSVVIMNSSFNWAFVKSMPDEFKPGLPYKDAKYLRMATAEILEKIQANKDITFSNKILVGTSYGALTGLLVADQESLEGTLGISNYYFVCPPIDIFYALKQIDSFADNNILKSNDLMQSVSMTSEKILQITNHDFTKDDKIIIPCSEQEAMWVINYSMRQKLYNLVFTIEKANSLQKNDIYQIVNNMSFYDYAKKYLIEGTGKSEGELSYASSLYSISNFLKNNTQYKIYHSADDMLTTPEQIKWLKDTTSNKTILFDNGSHLGFMYRKEFFDIFTKDIAPSNFGQKL